MAPDDDTDDVPSLEQLLEAACGALPLFPLPGMVFLPYTLLPLHVFEPRYRALVRDAVAGDGIIAVPQLLAPESAGGPPPAVAPVVGVGRIVQHQAMPDGRSNIVLAGIGRARIQRELAADTPYRVAQAVALTAPAADSALARPRLQAALAGLAQREPAVAKPVQSLLERDVETPGLCAAVAHMLLRDPAHRQAFLELEAESAQVEHLLVALAGVSAGPGLEA
jgi:Lon protease-like protein